MLLVVADKLTGTPEISAMASGAPRHIPWARLESLP